MQEPETRGVYDVPTKDAPRFLLYSQDGLGLGHLRRTSTIAAGLVRARPDAAVLTIIDSPLGPFFRPGPNQDCVKLPSIVKVSPGNWSPMGLAQPFSEVSALRRELLHATFVGFKPDVLLVDHMPHGAFGELLPTLDGLRHSARRPRTVIGLRDIIDAPDVVRRIWSLEGAYTALEEHYDAVMVYGRDDVFDPVTHYDFPAAVAERVHFTGYVCTPDRARYPSALRPRSSGNDGEKPALLVATAGGGADAHPVMSAVLDAVPVLRRDRPWSAVLVTGPFMPPTLRRDLEQRARPLGVRVRASVSDPLSYVQAADVVVAMAGYSSSVELLRSGTPAVLVPRRGPSAEQRMRASRFTDRGWVGMVDPDDLSGDSLADAVRARLADGGGPPPPPEGLDVAVDLLLSQLQDRPVIPAQPRAGRPAPVR